VPHRGAGGCLAGPPWDLWREAKGFESLDMGRRSRCPRGGGLDTWEAGGVAGLEAAEGAGFQGCHPVEIGLLCIRAWFGSCL
jgi:hypothetical protein